MVENIPPQGVNYHTDAIRKFRMFPEILNRRITSQELSGEIDMIAQQLHCNAMRIVGNNPNEAARIALESQHQGIEPWLSPRFLNATWEQSKIELRKYLQLMIDQGLADTPLILGNELVYDCQDLLGQGFSKRYEKRIGAIVKQYYQSGRSLPNITAKIQELIDLAREVGWTGTLTYATAPQEQIDWAKLQDSRLAVGSNLYWGKNWKKGGRVETPEEYQAKIQTLINANPGRRIVITEFGAVPHVDTLGEGGSAYHLRGKPDYDAQAQAYDAYLKVFSKFPDIGLFAYAFYEPKEWQPGSSFGIVSTNRRSPFARRHASALLPAGKRLGAFYKERRQQKGFVVET